MIYNQGLDGEGVELGPQCFVQHRERRLLGPPCAIECASTRLSLVLSLDFWLRLRADLITISTLFLIDN